MTYGEFEIRFLLALVDAADAAELGQCEAFQIAEIVLPQVNEQWVRDAVRGYEQRKYLGHVVRSLGADASTITLMIAGEGRKAAEAVKAQIAEAQQQAEAQRQKPKIGY
jgi:hypothetical protein